jgi:hypothetical protein
MRFTLLIAIFASASTLCAATALPDNSALLSPLAYRVEKKSGAQTQRDCEANGHWKCKCDGIGTFTCNDGKHKNGATCEKYGCGKV